MHYVRHLKNLFLLLLTLGLVISPVVLAQENVEPPPVAPSAPTAPAEPEAPVVSTTEAETSTDEETTTTIENSDEETPAQTTAPEAKKKKSVKQWSGQHRNSGNERVSFGSDSTLAAGESAGAVVSIGGSSTSAGDVSDAVVSIIGGSRVTGGTVGDAVVSVLGNTYVNGHVKGEVVTVLGNVELGPQAVVDGELVCIGGLVTRDPAAVVKGGTQNIGIAGHHFNFDRVSAWFTQCLFYARPLAFNQQLTWAWFIAFAFLVVYALIALIAPTGVNKCVETLEQRPGTSLLAALLTLLLTPVVYILLAVTLAIAVGFVLIPLFSLGLFFASVFGKIVMLAWLGRRFTNLSGNSTLAHPVFGVLIGGIIVMLLYTIPVAGFIIYKLLGILGLGVVVYTLIIQFKASRPPKPRVVTVPQAPAPSPMTSGVVPPADTTGATPPPVVPPVAMMAVPVVISAATLPRAGFWHRLGASFIDFVMWGVVMGITSGMLRGWLNPGGSLPFWFAVYCIAMWATKGTTIGGIICGLKVVRIDDRPLDWGVAVVRALGGFLSLAMAGLGFIWVAFDDEKQSWHDKIAGTTIVKVPKGTALI